MHLRIHFLVNWTASCPGESKSYAKIQVVTGSMQAVPQRLPLETDVQLALNAIAASRCVASGPDGNATAEPRLAPSGF